MDWKKAGFPCYQKVADQEIEAQKNILLTQFIQYFDFDRQAYGERIGSYERFLNGKNSYNSTKLSYSHDRNYDELPDHDHVRYFKKAGTKDVVVVNQPYQFDKTELDQWCSERNLKYLICQKSHSFYYPRHSEMILIMSQNTYEHYQTIKDDFPKRWESE